MGVRERNLPFKVRHQIESRSFLDGYRGAWFRAKIISIHQRRNGLGYDLKFLDFPDEKVQWTKIYQKLPTHSCNRSNPQEMLMVRPHFPPVYRKSQMPNNISEAVVLVNDTWKVGDLVDWLKDDCYWSGSITEILEDDQVQITLFPPPLGEGHLYSAEQKDLRPSLDWSPEHGWTVPTPTDSGHGRCAQLIKPSEKGKDSSKSGKNQISVARTAGDKKGGVEDVAGASKSSSTSHVLRSLSQPRGKKLKDAEGLASEPNAVSNTENVSAGKTSGSDSKSDSFIRAKSTDGRDVATSFEKERLGNDVKRKRTQGVAGAPEPPFNSQPSSFSLSKSCNGCEDVVKKPLGAAAGTKRVTSQTNVELSKENGGTRKMSGSNTDSRTHVKAASNGTGYITDAVKDTSDGGEDRDVQVLNTTLQSLSHVLPSSTQPVDKFGTVEKQPLASIVEKEAQPPGMAMDLGVENARIRKTGCPVSDRRENGKTGVEKETGDLGGPSKKMRVVGKTPQNNSLPSDSIEGSVVDLEELLYLIKWMKGILENGNTTWPPWKFLGHRASTPR